MRILTHDHHAGFDYQLARTGHTFHVLPTARGWDTERPRPVNWVPVSEPSGEYDLILLSLAQEFGRFAGRPEPMLVNHLNDSSEGEYPAAIENRACAIVFLGGEVAARWALRRPSKRRVVELGVDESEFRPHDHAAAGPEILAVGHAINKRWDKGEGVIRAIHEVFRPVTVAGPRNDGMPGWAGDLPYRALLEAYRTCRTYLNACPFVGLPAAEAMMAGCPTVSFAPLNLRDLLVDGRNAFVVDTVDGAIMRLRRLLADEELRRTLGQAARETALKRFGFGRFKKEWTALFEWAACQRPVPAR